MTTTHWAANETSRRRNSFNAIIDRKTFDAPEADYKQVKMGRQAEFGPTYVPNPILARHRAGTLVATRAATYAQLPEKNQSAFLPDMTGSFGEQALRAAIVRETVREERRNSEMSMNGSRVGSPTAGMSLVGSPASQLSLRRASSSPALSPLKPGSPHGRSSSNTTAPDSPSAGGSAPGTPSNFIDKRRMSGSSGFGLTGSNNFLNSFNGGASATSWTGTIQGGETTTNWNVNEASVSRDSFNKIVQRQSCDVPESRMLLGTMGRKAEYDGKFLPNAIYARRRSGSLSG